MITNLLLWLWTGALTLLALWSYWLTPETPTAVWWQAAVYLLAPITAVVTGLTALRHYHIRSSQGCVLAVLLLGITSWCIGEVLWTYYDLVAHVKPYPSLADLFYLAAYLPLFAGFSLEVHFLRKQVQLSYAPMQTTLFAIIAALLAILAGYFGVYRAYQPTVPMLENVLAIAYGLADVALVIFGLVIAVVASELRGGKLAKPWWWFLCGITLIFIADIGFAMFSQPYEAVTGFYKPALDSLWIAGYLAFAYGFNQYAWLIQQVQDKVTTLQTSKVKVE